MNGIAAATALAATLAAVALELYLRRKDVDRRAPVPPAAFAIDNAFYSDVDWWAPHSEMRALRAMTPTRAAFFADALRRTGAGDAKVLDVGCGAGFVAMALAERGFDVVGLDPSDASLAQARAEAQRRGETRVRFAAGSAELLPVQTGTVDAVVMADVLEHLADLPRALDEVARVLKPGGVFLFDTINRTRWSYLLTIVALQHLGIGGICPPNTHDWSLYIRPDELRELLVARNLTLGELRGLQIRVTPQLAWDVMRGHNLEPEQFTIGDDLSANYIGYAVKAEAP